MFISIGSVIIDDIVMPDGITHMGCLGGGGVHAVMGMRVWSEKVGLVANIGRDFPSSLMEKLEKTFNVQGLIKRDMSTIRAWQLFETDGTRREVLRTDLNEFKELKPEVEAFPEVYDNLQGVHLHCQGEEVPSWVQLLRQRGNPFIFWEPWHIDCVAENRGNLINILPLVDCVSPNLQEARTLLGMHETDDLVNRFLEYGARMAVIREGAKGSTFADSKGNRIRVPAASVEEIVDETGAGNAYCGGLVVGFVNSDDPREALCRAAVSASFPLEQFGALFSLKNIKQRAESRYQSCMAAMLELNRTLQ